MGARKKFPEFDDLTAEDFSALLRLAKLSALEKEIATQYIVWHMCDADVAAAADRDRRTVARWMDDIILPELRRMMRKMEGAA